MSTHQMEQMDEQHPAATGLDSSDEEDEEDKRQKRKQREHESDHGQPNVLKRRARRARGRGVRHHCPRRLAHRRKNAESESSKSFQKVYTANL